MRRYRLQKKTLLLPKKTSQLEQYGNSSESRIVQNKCTSLIIDMLTEEEEQIRQQKQEEKELRIQQSKQARKEMACQRFISPNKSMRTCGKWSIKQLSLGKVDCDIEIWIDDKDARLHGMATCDSAWCRNCARKRVAQRAIKVQNHIMPIIKGEQKGSVWFFTGTIPRHHDIEHQKLKTRRGWKSVKNALDYQVKKKKAFNYQSVRSLDITFKPTHRNKYHCHYHIIIVFDDEPSDKEAYKRIVRPWLKALKGTSSQSQDLQAIISEEEAISKSRYVAKKAGLGLELGLEIAASATTKTSKGKGLSFAELLTVATDEDRDEIGIYRQCYKDFLVGIKGSNTISFSRNWPETDDTGEEEEPKIKISIPEYWHSLVLSAPGELSYLLYKSYVKNQRWIIRDFQKLMETKNAEELDRLATTSGLTVFTRVLIWEKMIFIIKKNLCE